MDVFDKAGRAVGDAIARARERERLRIDDRIGLLEAIDEAAREIVQKGKQRPGYSWDQDVEKARLVVRSRAAAAGDPQLREVARRLASIVVPHGEAPAPEAALDQAYDALVDELARVRGETLADD